MMIKEITEKEFEVFRILMAEIEYGRHFETGNNEHEKNADRTN